MRIRRVVIGVAVLGVALAGCSSSPPAAPTLAAQAEPSVGIVSTPNGNASPTTSASAAEVTTAPIGSTQAITFEGQSMTVTVHEVKPITFAEDDVVASLVDQGQHIVGVDVEVCSPVQNTVQAMDRWWLVDSTNGRYEPTTAAPSNLAPKYPYSSSPVSAGECVRGWITYKVPDSATPAVVRYSTSKGYTLRWNI